jgi:hypothetical protein
MTGPYDPAASDSIIADDPPTAGVFIFRLNGSFMPISITCMNCRSVLSAPDAAVGKRGQCPKCKTAFVVPDPKASEGFEVLDDPGFEVLEDDMPVAEVVDDARPAAGRKPGKTKKPNARRKAQVDPSDYRTRVNGKPLAVKPGEASGPGYPRNGKG